MNTRERRIVAVRRAPAWRSVGSAIAAIASLMVAAPAALATFPGANGRIAYKSVWDSGTTGNLRAALFVTESGQLTFPISDHDFFPAWSPDGAQIAFLRNDGTLGDDLIMIVEKDGGGLRQLISSDAFDQVPPPGTEIAHVSQPTWSADGKQIAFGVRHDGRPNNVGVWAVRSDGTGLIQLVRDIYASAPDWSPLGTEIAYLCSFRATSVRTYDLCVVNAGTHAVRQLPIDWENRGGNVVGPPAWSPTGEKILFTLSFPTYESTHWVDRQEIFSINADGTGLTRVTYSPDACPDHPSNTTAHSLAEIFYLEPVPSPDGESIVAGAYRNNAAGEMTISGCKYLRGGPDNLDQVGLWTLNAGGGPATLLLADPNARLPDWQPIPADLTVVIDDGHDNPLKGLKVELRTKGGMTVDDEPVNTIGGSYAFEKDIAPGEYVVRATLIDNESGPFVDPSFDIRHNLEPTEPVWVEWSIDVPTDASVVSGLSFEGSSDLVASSVSQIDFGRIDDMANIYFRVRQFVDWVKLYLTPTTGPTVEFYTFAALDPFDETDVKLNTAYYRADQTAVVFGIFTSEFENRDGDQDLLHTDDAPENVEWHEFTHHLYEMVSQSSLCVNVKSQCGDTNNSVNHCGYRNPDTCDSMYEGFANFLPALAAQAIGGASDSYYDGLVDLEDHTKAWGLRSFSSGTTISTEDLAVPAVFWDLVDTNADHEDRQVIGADGEHRLVTYTDQESIPLRTLWKQLTSAHPRTMIDFRRSFDTPAITIDLDGDGVPDIARLDQVFLMHGFFPVANDQAITTAHRTYHYQVGTSIPRNNTVGESGHREYNGSGTETKSLDPREKTPLAAGANLEIQVRDASGTPLAGAAVDLVVQYPGREHTIRRRLSSGDGDLVHLELPAYFDYLLPTDAPLPPCDSPDDLQVGVTLVTTLNGYVSADSPSFDNCAYMQAIDAATGPAALSFAVMFPEDATAPVTTIDASASEPPIGDYTTGAWTVSLSCDDPVENGFAAGCDRTEYSIDGQSLELYRKPVVIAGVGLHRFEFRSIDAAANEEGFRSLDLGVTDDPDTDGDGLSDGTEVGLGTDPLNPDTDGDGLLDGAEVNDYGTDPLDADSDHDGLSDGAEVSLGTDPLNPDSDSDGLSDGAEVAGGTDPLDADSDDDGIPDGADNCALLSNPSQDDYEGDGMGDACDADDDNDGVPNVTDRFPHSDLNPSVVINSCNTGVYNNYVDPPYDANMNDLIGVCAANATSNRQFVRCVSQLANKWRRAGLISSAEKRAIVSCAKQASL